MSHDERKRLIVPLHPQLSVGEQAKLLGISRSSFYYTPVQNPEDKKHMDMIDAIYTDLPFYGSRRIQNELRDRYDEAVCRERIRRLMRLMEIEAVYPKPDTSAAHPEYRKYPYLLRNTAASFPNHIWGTDITYIRLEEGWAYLIAYLDWFSRYVIAWELSLSMETEFCIAALDRALRAAAPKIHNSDQGSQFTNREYTEILKGRGIAISMDGRGRCMDNIFTERLWRTVKRENVYLMSYRNVAEARSGLTEYFAFYNTKRRHQSLEYRTPAEAYFGKV